MSAHDQAAHPGGATLAARRTLKWIRAARSTRRRHGQADAVVLPITEYDQLLEDLHDLAVVVERRDEKTIDEAELKRRLAGGGAA